MGLNGRGAPGLFGLLVGEVAAQARRGVVGAHARPRLIARVVEARPHAEDGHALVVAVGDRVGGVEVRFEDGAANALCPIGIVQVRVRLILNQRIHVQLALLQVHHALFDGPLHGVLHANERTAVLDPGLDVVGGQVVEAATGQHHGVVAVEVRVLHVGQVDQGHRHVHALAQEVPGLSCVVGARAAVPRAAARSRDNRDLGRTQNRGVATPKIRPLRGHPLIHGVDVDVVVLGDALNDLVDAVRGHATLFHLHDNGAPVKRLRRSVDARRERIGHHAGADVVVVEALHSPRGVVLPPGQHVGVLGAASDDLAALVARVLNSLPLRRRVGDARVLHAEGQRQAPGRHVVEDRVGVRGGALHGRLHKAALRLVERDHVGVAGPEGVSVGLDRLVEIKHPNLVAVEHLRQGPGPGGLRRLVDEEGLGVGVLERLVPVGKEVTLILQQVGPHFYDGPHRRERGHELVAHREGIGQLALARLLRQGPRGGLLEENPNRAVDVRVRRSLSVVEVVERLPGVVEGPDLVEVLAVAFRDAPSQFLVRLWGVGVGAALHARLEEVGRLRSHLVEVREHLRLPVVEVVEPSLRGRVLTGQPVPVQVKPVVVGASPRPRLVVLTVLRVGRGRAPPVAIDPVHEAVAPVGIEHRVDECDRVFEGRLDVRPTAGRHVVQEQNRGLRAARLVAVDAVPHEDDGRTVLQVIVRHLVRRGGGAPVGALDLVEVFLVVRARHDGVDELPPLVGAAVLSKLHPFARLRHRLKVAHDLGRTGVARPNFVADDLRGGGNGVVIAVGPREGGVHGEREVLTRHRRRHETEADENGPENHEATKRRSKRHQYVRGSNAKAERRGTDRERIIPIRHGR